MNRQGIGMMVVWIFVMIAGGLILLLFFFMADSTAENARTGLSLQALQQVESILVTQQASDNTYATIPIPREDILFTCNTIPSTTGPGLGGINSEIRIGGLPQDKQYQLMVGRDMNADALLVFSYRTMVPFSIGNILYVSNEQEALVFQGSGYDQQIESLTDLLPPPIRDSIISNPDASRYQNTRVVSFGSQPQPVISPQDAVYIEVEADRILDQGKIIFWRYSTQTNSLERDGTREYYYSGMPMLMAYIWMGDDDRAMCFSYKLSRRINHITELQADRMATLRFEATERAGEGVEDACAPRYSTVQLDNLREAAQLSGTRVFEDLPAAVQAVRLQNEALLRGNRCATIY